MCNNSIEYIKKEVSNIKKSGNKIITNYFTFNYNNKIINIYKDEKSIFFIIEDNMVFRGYFFSTDEDNLSLLLKKVKEECIVEILTKDEPLKYDNIFLSSGFVFNSIFKRYSNDNLKLKLNESIPNKLKNLEFRKYGKIATLDDVDLLHNKLYETFDHRTSHLPEKDEIANMILNNQIVIEKENNDVVAFLIYKIEGCKYYVNQIYNSVNSEVIHSILYNSIIDSMKKNVNYAYAWIDENNIRSIKFHEKYGMRFDGLSSISYIKEGGIA